MEIKYEAVFGPQSLFDDALDDIVAIRLNNYSCLSYGYLTKDKLDVLGVSELKAIPIVAMRRIIRTPTWTVADQKAGMLPEVGCRVNFCHKLNTNWRTGEIKYIDDQVTVIKADDIDRPFVYEVDRVEFKPSESPEEKAARLREEWCSNALDSASILSGMREYDLKRFGGYIGNIYDALLSGDLPVPVKGE